jgi:hypothetical protein
MSYVDQDDKVALFPLVLDELELARLLIVKLVDWRRGNERGVAEPHFA